MPKQKGAGGRVNCQCFGTQKAQESQLEKLQELEGQFVACKQNDDNGSCRQLSVLRSSTHC